MDMEPDEIVEWYADQDNRADQVRARVRTAEAHFRQLGFDVVRDETRPDNYIEVPDN